MNFEELYKAVLIKEKDNDEVPVPEDFDDVEPLPLPDSEGRKTQEASEEEFNSDNEGFTETEGSNTTLKDYIFKLEDFAEKLNGTEGNSLAALVASLDRPGTPFEGISSRTSTDIIASAKTLREIVETLKNFLIQSVK